LNNGNPTNTFSESDNKSNISEQKNERRIESVEYQLQEHTSENTEQKQKSHRGHKKAKHEMYANGAPAADMSAALEPLDLSSLKP